MEKYIPVGNITTAVKLPYDQILYLYRYLIGAKVSSVDFFYDGDRIIIGFMSFFTSMNGYATFSTKLTETKKVVIEEDTSLIDLEEDWDFELEDTQIVGDYGVVIGEKDVVEEKPILRFRAPTLFLLALYRFTPEATITVNTEKIIFDSPYMHLVYNSSVTSSTLEDYYRDSDVDIWEKVNTQSIKTVTDIAIKMEKDMAERTISLIDDSITTKNKEVIVRAKSWKLKKNYLLTGSILNTLAKLPRKVEVLIATTDKFLIIKVGNIRYNFINTKVMPSHNIMDLINMNDLIMLCQIEKKHWSDFNVLKCYADFSQKDYAITLSTMNNCIEASQGDATIKLPGKYNKGFSLQVDINQLLTCYRCSGSPEPELYFSVNDGANFLYIKGEVELVIRIEKKEISKEYKESQEFTDRLLERASNDMQSSAIKEDKDIPESMEDEEQSKVVQELDELDSAFDNYVASSIKPIQIKGPKINRGDL